MVGGELCTWWDKIDARKKVELEAGCAGAVGLQIHRGLTEPREAFFKNI